MNEKPYYYLVKAPMSHVLKTIPDRLKELVVVQAISQEDLSSLSNSEFLPYQELDAANIFHRTVIIAEWYGVFTSYRFNPLPAAPVTPVEVDDGGYW